jgi:hypothetical protein
MDHTISIKLKISLLFSSSFDDDTIVTAVMNDEADPPVCSTTPPENNEHDWQEISLRLFEARYLATNDMPFKILSGQHRLAAFRYAEDHLGLGAKQCFWRVRLLHACGCSS